MKTSKRGLGLLLTAALIVFILMFSTLYVALEADHDCCGEDCEICSCIIMSIKVAKTLGLLILSLSAVQNHLNCFSNHDADNASKQGLFSLVSINVRLNN